MELLLGTYNPKFDEKGRIILPAKFRDTLSQGLVLTRGQEHCLYIFPRAEFGKIYHKLQDSETSNKRAYLRLLAADAISDTPDKQGRLLVPAKLREYANLDGEMTVIGVGSRVEIWNTEAWEKYQGDNLELYSEMVEGIF